MQVEFNALISNQTWSLCPHPLNKKVVRNKWVFKLKWKSDDTINWYKAHLVANGFDEEYGIDFKETFIPIIKPTTIWLVFALAIHFDWFIQQLNISSALFLHCYLEYKVFMEQPKEFEDSNLTHHMCKLHRPLQGIKQAPRTWFMRLSQALLELGFIGYSVDTSLFTFHHQQVTILAFIYA